MSPDTHAHVVLSCEHASNTVPDAFLHLFDDARHVLATHRAYDPGAIHIAGRMRDLLGVPLHHTTLSRLLIEANRSLHHPELFSEFARTLPPEVKRALIDEHHTPHVTAVTETVDLAIRSAGHALHVGVHTCVDVLDGMSRELDIALLFDPAREWESLLCAHWRLDLETQAPHLRIRFNEPYLGTDDGLTTSLRAVFPATRYAGIEIEVRQGLVTTEADAHTVADLLARTLPRHITPTDDA
ncbi:MAG: N-formylglutamate amidohydrolase [Phycisphaerales bacterium]